MYTINNFQALLHHTLNNFNGISSIFYRLNKILSRMLMCILFSIRSLLVVQNKDFYIFDNLIHFSSYKLHNINGIVNIPHWFRNSHQDTYLNNLDYAETVMDCILCICLHYNQHYLSMINNQNMAVNSDNIKYVFPKMNFDWHKISLNSQFILIFLHL